MSLGERAAVMGILAQLEPSLAIEIGSAEGSCLQRLAAHSGEVHSFDLHPPSLPVADNVHLHTGNSHQLLPEFLAGQERNVDLVIVDGDHGSDGVRQDLEALLDSRALAQTVILIHDTANEVVRQGLDSVRFTAWPKVAYVQLDWIPGQLFAEPALRNELWYGLGLVLVDSARLAYDRGPVYEERYHPAAPLLAEIRQLVSARERMTVPEAGQPDAAAALGGSGRALELARELVAARQQVAALQAERDALADHWERAERALNNIKGSASWKLTEPLRSAKRLVGAR
jgi:hypothetical protein